MGFATAKAEATRIGLPHTHIPQLTQPLTCQHVIESLPHREQGDGSTSVVQRNNPLLPDVIRRREIPHEIHSKAFMCIISEAYNTLHL